MAPKQEQKQKWRRKLVQPVDGAAHPPIADSPPVDGALQPPQVDQPAVPDPLPSSAAVIGTSSADRNQPSPLGAQHRLQQGSTGRSPRGRSTGGRFFPYHPSRDRGRGTQPPPHTSPPPPHPSPLHRTAQQQHLVSPHISPTTTTSPNTPSSLGTPQQPRRVTRTSPAATSPSSSLQTPQQHQPNSSSRSPLQDHTVSSGKTCVARSPSAWAKPHCPVDGALRAPQVNHPLVPDPLPSSPAVIGSSSAEQNQPSPLRPQNRPSTLSPPPGTVQQGSTGRSYHPPPSRGRGTQEVPPGSSASQHRSPPLPPLHRAGQHEQQQPGNTNISLANSLLDILRGFILGGEKCAFYKAEVASLARRGSSVLNVDFEHLFIDIDLAVEIANDNDSSYQWLRSAVRTFFSEQCNEMKNEQKKKFIEGASVSFSNKPESMFSLKYVKAIKEELVKVIQIIRGQETCRAASMFGTEAYLAILIFVIGKHKIGQSWDGDFAEQDVYFFRYPGRPLECRILKSTTPNPVTLSKRDGFNLEQCTPLERRNDFGTVDLLMTPNYEDADGKLPVFFDELHEDLKDSLASTVVQQWFIENLEFNLALMSSAARKILTVAMSNLIRSLKLSSKEDYDKILEEAPYKDDWRENFRDDKGVMGGVYWYENEERDKEMDLYHNTMESVMEYEKNIHDHCHEYLEVEKRLDDFDESELLIAVKLPKVLGKLVKALMRLNMMKGVLAQVRGIYCLSRSAQKEPAAAMLYVHDEVHGTQNETTEQSGEP